MTRQHYEILTAAGVVCMTFDNAADAKAYCLKMKAQVPGLGVDEVTVTTTRRSAYRPRQRAAA